VAHDGTATIALLAPVAQLDRASVYGTEGRGFEFLRAHYESPALAGLSSLSKTPTRLVAFVGTVDGYQSGRRNWVVARPPAKSWRDRSARSRALRGVRRDGPAESSAGGIAPRRSRVRVSLAPLLKPPASVGDSSFQTSRVGSQIWIGHHDWASNQRFGFVGSPQVSLLQPAARKMEATSANGRGQTADALSETRGEHPHGRRCRESRRDPNPAQGHPSLRI
jgi:hypothetical protein